jgi:hypothetical protein
MCDQDDFDFDEIEEVKGVCDKATIDEVSYAASLF